MSDAAVCVKNIFNKSYTSENLVLKILFIFTKPTFYAYTNLYFLSFTDGGRQSSSHWGRKFL